MLQLGGETVGFGGAAAIAATFFLAGLVKGAAAFGVPLVAVPLLSTIVPVPTAAALTVLPIVASNVVQAVQTRQAARVVRRLWPLFLVLPLTLAVSIRLIESLDANVLHVLIGGLMGLFVLLQLSGRIPPISERAQAPVLALSGLTAGLLGGVTSFFSFPTLQVFLALRLTPQEFAFATSAMFVLGSVVMGAGFAVIGLLEVAELAVSIAALVPLLVGLQFGQAVARRLSTAAFRRVVLALMAVMGGFDDRSRPGLVALDHRQSG